MLPCHHVPLPFLEILLPFDEARLRCLEAALLLVEDLLRFREAVYHDLRAERDLRDEQQEFHAHAFQT